MIPRYQRITFWSLCAAILIMTLVLVRGCQRNRERIAALRDQSPIAAPTNNPAEPVTLATANDTDGSITLAQGSLPLPEETSLRARILLDRLLADAALPTSLHPLPAGPAVTDVFLLNLPLTNPGANSAFPASVNSFGPSNSGTPRVFHSDRPHIPGAQLAVVNLTKTFADAHPSGIETEDLTLRAILATLHANFPEIEQARFLVDGQLRDTLAGHADLTRPYAVADPAHAIHVLSSDGDPL